MNIETTQATNELFYVERKNGKIGLLTKGIVDANNVVQVDPISLRHNAICHDIKKDGEVTELRIPLAHYLEQIENAKAKK